MLSGVFNSYGLDCQQSKQDLCQALYNIKLGERFTYSLKLSLFPVNHPVFLRKPLVP